MTRIYAIPDTDCNINENKIKSLIPLAGIRYNLDRSISVPYITISEQKEFVTTDTLSLEQLATLFYSDTLVETEKNDENETFKHFPPSDLYLHPYHFECKTCIFPCHNKKQLFELIIRQNNVACCLRNVIQNNPTVQNLLEDDLVQNPYMLISLYDEKGLKTFILSDMALIGMIYKHSITNKSNRSKVVWDAIMDMMKSYQTSGAITYKETKHSTVPHQKLTLYPVEFIKNLKRVIQDILYVRYDQIIHCEQVYKQRNICDYINNQLTYTRMLALEKEVLELRQKMEDSQNCEKISS